MADLFWDQLLQFIEEGRVVPIVGPDLLTVGIDGRPGWLYASLAEKLAASLEVPAGDLPPGGALHEVACRYLSRGGQLEDFYPALKAAMPKPEKLPVPEPLLQLAAIRPFKLFVSTTFDSLLERAVNEVRFGGQPRTRVYAYSPTAVKDLEAPLDSLDLPAVFHLFGRLSAAQDYAVTEEDVLEFVHSLQSENRRPDRLFDELDRRQLLLLGGSFPDWLARFFLRTARRERLFMVRGKTDIVADSRLREDSSHVQFLQRFSSRTRVFQGGGAVEFVAELHQRWTALHPPGTEAPAPGTTGLPADIEPGAVFLSFANEDRPVAEALKAALESAGVDVWLDQDDLRAGDDYEIRIRRAIEQCGLFVALLSRNSLTSQRRFFRLEWDHAQKVALRVPLTMSFIVPVVIDDTLPSEPAIPETLRKIHWRRLEGGRIDPDFVGHIRQLFREYQKTLAGVS